MELRDSSDVISNSSNSSTPVPSPIPSTQTLSRFVLASLSIEGAAFTNFSSVSMQKAFQSGVSNPLTINFGWPMQYQVLGWCSLSGVICEISRSLARPAAATTTNTRSPPSLFGQRAPWRRAQPDGAVVYYTLRRVDGLPITADALAYLNASDQSAPESYLVLAQRIMKGLGASVDSVYWFAAPVYCEAVGAGACNVTAVLAGLRSAVFDLSSIWSSDLTFELSRDRRASISYSAQCAHDA